MKAQSIFIALALLLAVCSQVATQVSMITCKNASSDKTSCLQCNNHYHLHEGQCYVDIPSCISYVFGNICRQCKNGLILVNNECCDRVCMSKIYNQEQHDSKIAQNKEDVLRRAEVDGLERSIASIAKNSVKSGQNYDITSSKCQRFERIFRYFVELEINNKQYIAINDYNIVTGTSVFISLLPKEEQIKDEVTLTEENIHGNLIYEKGYKFIYEKFGLDLYELQFVRMTAVTLGKSTELKFVFVGNKALLIQIMVSEAGEPYVLWKQEKTNVIEIKQKVDSLKKIDTLSKQQNFKQVFGQMLKSKNFQTGDIQILDIVAVSQTQYIFFLYHKILKLRFKIQGFFSTKTGKATLKKVEEVYSTKLQEIKVPQTMEIKIITKDMLTKSVESKEIFDFIYKLRPTFRQNLVQNVKLERGQDVTKILVVTKKDNKDYRIVVLRDSKTQQMQIIDEGYLIIENPTATIITTNNDASQTVITNKIDTSRTEVKVVLETLTQNNLKVDSTQIESLEYTQGTKSVDYTVVIKDNNGNPYKQVTLLQDKITKKTTVIDETSLVQQIKITRPKTHEMHLVPANDYYKPEMKEIISKVEQKVSKQVAVNKISKIEYSTTSQATKYHFVAQNSKGKTVHITALQPKGETSIEVIGVQSDISATLEHSTHEIKTVKMITESGVKVDYTNNKEVISSNQNINVAITSITSQQSDLKGYEVVSSQVKTYVNHQSQILVLTNGEKSVQVVGNIDQKTLRYVLVERKEIPLEISYPVVSQITVPSSIYLVTVQQNSVLKYAESVLLQKYKMFKNKIPISTTIQKFHNIEVITYSYQVGQKKFIAVVQYDKLIKENTKIIQVNPIDISVPIKFDQTVIGGKTITTSNSVEQIHIQNSHTKTVISKVLVEYPLLKKYNLTEITLTESDYSNLFEVTYTNQLTKQETTLIVRTDLQGKTITIEDIQTIQSSESPFSESKVPIVIYKPEEFSSHHVKSIIEVVSTKIKVDSIKTFISETHPTYVIFQITLESGGKPYKVTMMESNGERKVISVSSTHQETETITTIQTTTKIVDQNGNTVIKTTDKKYIKTLSEITLAVNQIISLRPQVSSWTVVGVVIVDYGNMKQISITFQGKSHSQQIKSNVIYNTLTKEVKVISTKKVQVSATTTQQLAFQSVTTPIYVPVVLPSIAITTQIKTDKKLQTVVQQIQKLDVGYVNVLPVSTQVQQLSESVTQYTSVMQVQGKQQQVVVIYNSTTSSASVLSTTTVNQTVKPYYIQQITGENGVIITSNNVKEIISTRTEFSSVLEYCNKWISVKTDYSNIEKVHFQPSPASGTVIYKIEIIDAVKKQTQTIEVVYNQKTKEMTVNNLDIIVPGVILPKPAHKIIVDIKSQEAQVKKYMSSIQNSQIAVLQEIKQNIKEFVSVQKEETQYYEKTYAVVQTKDKKQVKITLMNQPGEQPIVISIDEAQHRNKKVSQGKQTEYVDINGNKIKEISGSTHITHNIATSTSIQTVISENQAFKNYAAISAQTIDYGAVQQVSVVLVNKESKQVVQTTTLYNTSSNTATVISVQPSKLPYIGEKEIFVQQIVIGERELVKPSYPTIVIPKVALAELTLTDKFLSIVIAQIKQSNSNYMNVLPSSAQIQQLSSTIRKYTIVMETKTSRDQIVVIYDSTSKTSTTISVKPIPTTFDSTYIQEKTLVSGETVYTSTSITTMTQKFSDFRFVVEKIKNMIPDMKVEQTVINVVIKDSVNTYTIQTIHSNQKVVIQVNYDFISNQAYVINFHKTPLVIVPPAPINYIPGVINNKDRNSYIQILRNSQITEIKNSINIISSKTSSSILYYQTILEVQVSDQKSHYVKLIHTHTDATPRVIYVGPVLEQPILIGPSGLQGETISAYDGQRVIGGDRESLSLGELTTTKNDENGNLVTESTDRIYIQKHSLSQIVLSQLMRQYQVSKHYRIKYFKTVAYGSIIQVITILSSSESNKLDLKSIVFYNKANKSVKIISLKTIDILHDSHIHTSTSVFPTVVVYDTNVNVLIQQDAGFKIVLTTLQKSSQEYSTIVPYSIQVQVLSESVTKYNVVFDVLGRKEERVYTFHRVTNKVELHATVVVPSVIKSVVSVQKTINNEKVVITNQIEKVRVSHPETISVISSLKKEQPSLVIDQIVVIPQSNSSLVTLISPSHNGKEIVVNKYVHSESTATKISQETVKVTELVVPKQMPSVIVTPSVISTLPAVQKQLIKIVNVNTTQSLQIEKIEEVTVTKNAHMQIYHIRANDANNRSIKTQISYNPSIGQATVIDVSSMQTQKITRNTTVIQETTGVASIITYNSPTITHGKEYQQIYDFMIRNHPNDNIPGSTAVISAIQKYQRSVVRTVVLRQESSTIQATYLIDQRTQSIAELAYHLIKTPLLYEEEIPIKTETKVYTKQQVSLVIATQLAVSRTIAAINKVDSALSTLTPVYVEVDNYGNSAVVTIVFDTPSSNARILTIFNKTSGEAKVIDYSKVNKVIQGSKTVETINKFGQKIVFTDNTTTISTTKEFTSVIASVEELYPSMRNKTIRGVETISKSSGTEYKLVVVQNGVISQLNVLSDKATNKVSVISTLETTVSEKITSMTKTTHKQTVLDVKTIQSKEINVIRQTVISHAPHLFDSTAIIISGSVTDVGLALTYELIISSREQTTSAVKITIDKSTNKIIINDIKPIVYHQSVVVPTKTSVTTDIYGNTQFSTNSLTEIKQSTEIQTVIKKVYEAKPQLAVLVPLSTNTVSYGKHLETTVVFGAHSQQAVQITSVLNTQTKEVTIINSRVIAADIKTIKEHPLVIGQIQNIPLVAIAGAIRRYPQIKQIVAFVQKIGKLESLEMENLMEVRKYIAVTINTSGKMQHIYLFHKNTNQLDLLHSLPVPADIKNQIYSTTTNQFGQVITTSTSVEQISTKVTEVSTAIASIKEKYNIDTSANIKLIEIRGTAAKEIKVVTQSTTQTSQTVFTCLVEGKKTTILDVQVQPSTIVTPSVIAHPTVISQPIVIGQPTVISVEQNKVIAELVYNHTVVQQYFSRSTIINIKDHSNAFTISYEVVLQNSKGETATITLIQTQDRPLYVVDVISAAISTKTTTVQKETMTSTTVNMITGNKITISNDQQVIKSDIAIKLISQSVISKVPALIGYSVSHSTTTQYNQVSETELIFSREGKSAVRVTTLVDAKTSEVRVISQQTITEKTVEVTTSVQTIPASAIAVASKKWPEVINMITNIRSLIASAIVETLLVKDLAEVKIYTAIVTVPQILDSKTEYVFVYDKSTRELKLVDKMQIPTQIKVITYEKKTDKFGQTIIKTNDIAVISQTRTDLIVVINQINNQYGSSATRAIKALEVTEQAYSTQYKFLVEVNGKLAEVIAIKQNNEIKVLGLDLIQTTTILTPPIPDQSSSKGRQGRQGQSGTSTSVVIVPMKSDIAAQLFQAIRTSGVTSLQKVQITSITSTQSYLNTIYTVTTKNTLNHIHQVTISVAPGQPFKIIHIQEHKHSSQTTLFAQSQTTKQVSVITGQTITVTTQKQEVTEYATVLTPQVIKVVPQVAKYHATSVKATQVGELTWTTLVYASEKKSSEIQNVIQVTTLFNASDSRVTVVQNKPLVILPQTTVILPQTNIFVIPSMAIAGAIQRLPELSQIITQISRVYRRELIESVQIEVFGVIQKITIVVDSAAEKTVISYIYNRSINQIRYISTTNIPTNIEPLIFKQEINQYGQTTTITNRVVQVTSAITQVQSGIKYIWNKYPVTKTPTPLLIKVIEYPKEFILTLITSIQTNNQLTVMVSIDKATEQVSLISTYTQNDAITPQVITPAKQHTSTKQHTSSVVQKQTEVIVSTATEVTNVVKYIQSTSTVPVSRIKKVLFVEKTTTVFGSQVITIQAITDQNTKIKIVVDYNPKTKEYSINDFVVIEQPKVPHSIHTEFTVDLITGSKVTVTNNPTVIASSSILKTITQQVTTTTGMSNSIITQSSSTEYGNKVKVVSIFTDQISNKATQVVSIFDKTTSQVQIIEARNTTTTTTDIKKEVFTATQISTFNKTEIKTAVELISKQNPKYFGLIPETVVVQSLKEVDIVSAIYQTNTTVKTQVLTMFDKKTQTLTVLQSNPVQPYIKPFFYEEKQNQQGQQVIISNSITEVKQRVETASTLHKYITSHTQIAAEKVQTVQLVVRPNYHEYTILEKTGKGIVQHEFILNVETKEVREINKQVITADIPVLEPKKPVVIAVAVESKQAKLIIDQIMRNSETKLTNEKSIISIKKEDASKLSRFEIEYATEKNTVSKIIVVSSKTDHKITVVDQRPIIVDFVKKQSIVVKQTIDEVSKSLVTVYPSLDIFKLDADSAQIIAYLYKVVTETTKYTIESARKEKLGNIVQYDILLKAKHTAPMQITIAKDHLNKNIIVLEKRTISEKIEKSVIETSVDLPIKLQVSDIQKENIKVLSKLGLVKDIKQYIEVRVQQVSRNDQFMQAINSIKTAYSTILHSAVIIKTLEKKQLEKDRFKVFFKAKDQIYEASIEINTINGETKLTEFIKIGTQSYPKSEVNVYSDLCYGYQPIEDLSIDSNLDFISNHLKQKHDSLKESSLVEAQQITLSNGRTNYKLYFKKDSNTLKYIVYYEPEYKRILEVKGSSFNIGEHYKFLPKELQINDPYFRKLDTYLRQNSELLGSASILHTQSKDDGRTIQFRTVYSSQGKTFRQVASINKDNQNINQGTMSEIIQIPLQTKQSSTSECNYGQTKLDIHDLGKNAYFTECYKYVQAKYSQQLSNAQLLGAGEQANLNTFTYVFYFNIDENKITTLIVNFNPLTQNIIMVAQPETISLQDGYYPIRSDKKLTNVRNWLKENNPDLSSSVLVASLAKKFYFGTLYKIVFKISTKYLAYVVYMDCSTKEMKVYDTQELDSYNNNKNENSSDPKVYAGAGVSEGAGSTGEGDLQVGEGPSVVQPRLKGFARPKTTSS